VIARGRSRTASVPSVFPRCSLGVPSPAPRDQASATRLAARVSTTLAGTIRPRRRAQHPVECLKKRTMRRPTHPHLHLDQAALLTRHCRSGQRSGATAPHASDRRATHEPPAVSRSARPTATAHGGEDLNLCGSSRRERLRKRPSQRLRALTACESRRPLRSLRPAANGDPAPGTRGLTEVAGADVWRATAKLSNSGRRAGPQFVRPSRHRGRVGGRPARCAGYPRSPPRS
jgi:hypothetical protein